MSRRILLAEDDPREVELTLHALETFKLDVNVDVVNDGEEALDYLYRRGTYATRAEAPPALILLDLKMPKVSGLEVLAQIKADPTLRRVPVVVLTSSRHHTDVLMSYDRGTNAYVVKPLGFQEYVEALHRLGAFWALVNEPPP